jgi:catalase
MLLARGFSYSDAHRARLGVNYRQIPVNTPRVEVHSYSKDGAMRIRNATDPVYAPNSMGGPQADPRRAAEVHWHADGEMVRAAYALRPDDSDWGQPGTLVREVLDDEAWDRLAHNIVGHVSKGVREPVLSRVFEYWRNVDPDLGKKSRTRCAPISTATASSPLPAKAPFSDRDRGVLLSTGGLA